MNEPSFQWPEGFDPRSARLYIRNARTISAPVEQIWSWLVSATLWPSWFPNALVVGAAALPAGIALVNRSSRSAGCQLTLILAHR
jgi:hypothetical protein